MRPRRVLFSSLALVVLASPFACNHITNSAAQVGRPATGVHGAPPSASSGPKVKSKPTAKPSPRSSSDCTIADFPALPVPAHQPKVGPLPQEMSPGIPPDRFLVTIDDQGYDQHVGHLEDYAADPQRRYEFMFFPTQNWVQNYSASSCAQPRAVVARMYGEGFLVGNHSWSHPGNFEQLAKAKNQTKLKYQLQHGHASTYCRPPGGFINPAVRQLAAAQGCRLLHWTYTSEDTRGQLNNPSIQNADKLVADVQRRLDYERRHPEAPSAFKGGVLLFHMLPNSHIYDDPQHPERTALDRIIRLLGEHGLRPCRIVSQPSAPNIPFPLPCG